MAEQGVRATRVADIARDAGVTVGTVYRYFADKDAVTDAAIALHPPPPRPASPPARPGATLPALAEAARRWGAWFDGDGAKALRVICSDPARLSAIGTGPIGDAMAEFTGLLTTGRARGDLRADLDPQAVARALVGAIALGAAIHDRPDVAVADAVAALATRGLRPDAISWSAPR